MARFAAIVMTLTIMLAGCGGGGSSANDANATGTRSAEQTEVASVRSQTSPETASGATETAAPAPAPTRTPRATPPLVPTATPGLSTQEKNYLFKLDGVIGDILLNLDQGIAKLDARIPPVDEASFFDTEEKRAGDVGHWGTVPSPLRDLHTDFRRIILKLDQVDVAGLGDDASFATARAVYASALGEVEDLDVRSRAVLGLSERSARPPVPTPVPMLPLASYQPQADEFGAEYEVSKADKLPKDAQPAGFVVGERLQYTITHASFGNGPIIIQVKCAQFQTSAGADSWITNDQASNRRTLTNVQNDQALDLAADASASMSGLISNDGNVFGWDLVWFRQGATACSYGGIDQDGPWLQFMIDLARRVSDRTAAQQ